MITGVFRQPKPENFRHTLRRTIIYAPYLIIAVILAMALVIEYEVRSDINVGTLSWLKSNGVDIRAFGLYVAATAGVGAVLWHRVRRHFLSSMCLLFVVSLPYLFYTACATYYLESINNTSLMVLVIYWGGYLFCFALFTFISVLLAWLEVANFRGGG